MTHFNGKSMSNLASRYENNMSSLVEAKDFQLTFTQSQRFVPSFHEVWLFYQVWSILTQASFKQGEPKGLKPNNFWCNEHKFVFYKRTNKVCICCSLSWDLRA